MVPPSCRDWQRLGEQKVRLSLLLVELCQGCCCGTNCPVIYKNILSIPSLEHQRFVSSIYCVNPVFSVQETFQAHHSSNH